MKPFEILVQPEKGADEIRIWIEEFSVSGTYHDDACIEDVAAYYMPTLNPDDINPDKHEVKDDDPLLDIIIDYLMDFCAEEIAAQAFENAVCRAEAMADAAEDR